MRKHKVLVVAILLTALLSSACKPNVTPGPLGPTSPVVLILDGMEVAATAGAAALDQISGGTGYIQAVTILRDVADGISKTIGILEGTDTTANKIINIVAAFQPVIHSTLPPGTDQKIASIVGSVVPLVLDFIKQLQAANPPVPASLTHQDRAKLEAMRPKVQSIDVKMTLKLAR